MRTLTAAIAAVTRHRHRHAELCRFEEKRAYAHGGDEGEGSAELLGLHCHSPSSGDFEPTPKPPRA